MAEYKHGEMDIKEHVETFDGFVKFVVTSVVLIVCLLVFMAIFVA
ncbi:aa3-type cytochrome c oxidase subunit IV [Albibacillus kandeliae]|nr:aa3-type cytochrome c oxidase subunit IV [Albibacillus kandeliae]